MSVIQRIASALGEITLLMQEPQIAAVVCAATNERDVVIDVELTFVKTIEAKYTLAFLKLPKIPNVGDGVCPKRVTLASTPSPCSSLSRILVISVIFLFFLFAALWILTAICLTVCQCIRAPLCRCKSRIATHLL